MSAKAGRYRRRQRPDLLSQWWPVPLDWMVAVPVIAWVLLWGAINTGPWNLSGATESGLALINAGRAALPMLILLYAGIVLMSGDRAKVVPLTTPETFFWVYGAALLVASSQADPWFGSGYWAFSFLSVLAALRLFLRQGDPLEQIRYLNYFTWAVACIVLVALLIAAQDVLFAYDSGHGFINRASDFAGGTMSRSTGLARFAAIPAILAYVMFWRVKTRTGWMIAIAMFAVSVGLVWFMQSRGALFSLAFALGFLTLFMGKFARNLAVIGLVVVLAGGVYLIPEETRDYVYDHATRDMGIEGFESMSGRDVIWEKAFDAIGDNPIIGYGPQADRSILLRNAQNAAIYAWLCGGIVGLIGFLGGMTAAWWAFAQLLWQRFKLTDDQRDMMLMTGGLLAFFTMRSYPENTAALFSIDLLVQFPAMVYLATLYRFKQKERLQRRQYLANLQRQALAE